MAIWLWVKTNGIPFWLVGEFTTYFRTYLSGDWDVHWGYGILTHLSLNPTSRATCTHSLLWDFAASTHHHHHHHHYHHHHHH